MRFSGILLVLCIVFMVTVISMLPRIIQSEDTEFEQAAITCLHDSGSDVIIFEKTMTIHYESAWAISPEELRALTYLSKTYNIILITN